MTDASSNSAANADWADYVIDAALDAFYGLESRPALARERMARALDASCHAIPNSVQPGTFGPVFDAGVEEGKRQARHATPNSAAIEAAARRMLGRCGAPGLSWSDLEHESRVRWLDRAEDVLRAAGVDV